MWFDSLMDDFKRGFVIANKHKDIFVPVFLKLAMFLILGILGVIGVVVSISSGVFSGVNDAGPFAVFMSIIIPVITMLLIGYITFLILWALIEVGSISLFRAAIDDIKPTKDHFFDGIKNYLVRAASGKFLIHFIVLCLSPIWLILYVIFLILIGIPTAGWGLVFISVAIGTYFATWTIALVHDDLSIVKAIKMSFRIAKDNFKPMFVLVFSATMITKYVVTLLGPLGLLLTGWFIGGVSMTYFKVVLYLKYLAYSTIGDE